MRQRRLFIFLFLIISISSSTRLSANAYVGLFADGDRSSWCVDGEAFYTVEVWLWVLPGERGMICVEYGLHYPDNVILSTATTNPENICSILPVLDCGFPYEADCFFECYSSWMWARHRAIFVTNSDETVIEITPNQYTGFLQVNNCDEGYPAEPAVIFTNLYINYALDQPECLGTATAESSWGAIKSLYSR